MPLSSKDSEYLRRIADAVDPPSHGPYPDPPPKPIREWTLGDWMRVFWGLLCFAVVALLVFSWVFHPEWLRATGIWPLTLIV